MHLNSSRFPRSITAAGLLISAGALLAASVRAGSAENAPDALRHIRNLAGCFHVTYTFFEDAKHDTLARGRPLGPITEWVGLTTRADGAITLTHVSVTEGGRTVPHFHEIWSPNPDSATWTQEVRRGAPAKEAGAAPKQLRYRCTAPWTMNRWQCHAGPAEKPFRDSGAPFGFDRKDYDVLDRENILLVTPEGWVHNEHNRKMTNSGAVVSHELGWIEYRRIDESNCAPAREAFPSTSR